MGGSVIVRPGVPSRHSPGLRRGRLALVLLVVFLAEVPIGRAVTDATRGMQPAGPVRQPPAPRPTPLPAGSPFALVVAAPPLAREGPSPSAHSLPTPLPATQPTAASSHLQRSPQTRGPLVDEALRLALGLLGVAVLTACLLRASRRVARPHRARPHPLVAGVLVLALTGCASAPAASAPGQSPQDYLDNAIDWMETHALAPEGTDWQRVRQDALARAPHPRTTAETYDAIRFVLHGLGDVSAFFLEPKDFAELTGLGVTALYPQGTVVFVEPRSPAAGAGVREGDVLEAINDDPIRPQGGGPPEGYPGAWFVDVPHASAFRLVIRRPGQPQPIILDMPPTTARYDGDPVAHRFSAGSSARAVGYIELPWDGGWGDYATRTQRAIRAVDDADTCGWVVDLRRTIGGDFWTYLAGLGPILGEGDLGGFRFPSGAREGWAYRAGKVLWDGRQRDESYVADSIYSLWHQMPSVALLTSRATFAAGELVRVAFQGRPSTRSFGEPTAGRPVLLLHTPLSDGAHLSLGAAYAFDRTDQTYDRPIEPDQAVTVDWTLFGTPQDPVLIAALDWLGTQPACRS